MPVYVWGSSLSLFSSPSLPLYPRYKDGAHGIARVLPHASLSQRSGLTKEGAAEGREAVLALGFLLGPGEPHLSLDQDPEDSGELPRSLWVPGQGSGGKDIRGAPTLLLLMSYPNVRLPLLGLTESHRSAQCE